jgi:hypothetical protein
MYTKIAGFAEFHKEPCSLMGSASLRASSISLAREYLSPGNIRKSMVCYGIDRQSNFHRDKRAASSSSAFCSGAFSIRAVALCSWVTTGIEPCSPGSQPGALPISYSHSFASWIRTTISAFKTPRPAVRRRQNESGTRNEKAPANCQGCY